MKYLRKFETEAEKINWSVSPEHVIPNVVLTGDAIGYNVKADFAATPFYVAAIENLTIRFGNTYEYSKDNLTWTGGTSETSISANAGESVYFRASGLTPNSSSGIGTFTITGGTCNVAGNVMSLIYGSDYIEKYEIPYEYNFAVLFRDATSIISAEWLILPATTLKANCYRSMFNGCSNLITPPGLPANTLAISCYQFMFRSCSSIQEAPLLPAKQLADFCYSNMFESCTSLVNAPALPATTLEVSCYNYMFKGCTSLVNAPALPATELVENCYSRLFQGCSNLSSIKAMFTTSPSDTYTRDWVSGVASTGVFVKNSAATWNKTGTYAIPSGWTVETADA